MFKINHFLLAWVLLNLLPAHATEKPLSIEKQTIAGNYLTATEAHQFKRNQGEKILLVDVRSKPELVFVGFPENLDINIPFSRLNYNQWDKQKSAFKKVPNTHFISTLDSVIKSKGLTKDSPIVLLCRSGKRSAKAANLLTSNGYSTIYTVVDGFEGDKVKLGENKGKREVNGWKNAGLPWTYKLNKDRFNLR